MSGLICWVTAVKVFAPFASIRQGLKPSPCHFTTHESAAPSRFRSRKPGLKSGLRMRFLQHLLQVGIHEGLGEAVACRILRCNLLVWLGNSHDLDLRAVERLLQESMDVSMDQTHDANTQSWMVRAGGLRQGA